MKHHVPGPETKLKIIIIKKNIKSKKALMASMI